MRRIDIGLWVALCALPCLASAQDASMYGYCHVQVGADGWVSPVFEHPHVGNLGKLIRGDQDGFRQAVQANVDVPKETQVYCGYSAHRPAMEDDQRKLLANGPEPKAGGQYHLLAWAPPVPPPPGTGPLAAPEVPAALLATFAADPYFTVPAGNGSVIERVDERPAGTDKDAGTLVQSVRAQRDGNFCKMSQHLMLRQEQHTIVLDGEGLSWAGLMPLTTASRASSGLGAEESRQLAVSLRHEGDALFPLRQGAHTVLTLETQVLKDNDEVVPRDFRLDCTVGATTAAAAIVATATGEATELRCKSSSPSAPAVPEREVVYDWFADAGCFVNRPVSL